jgi:flagellar motor protein MotB
MGNYWFYRDDFTAAAEAFSRSVELDPSDKHARDMLLVNQLRAAESSRAGNLKALEAVGIAARRIASNAGGMVAPTRSHPGLPDPDGLKIIIPSDPVFLPAQAKLRPDGLKLLQLVSKELKGLTKNFSVQISVHTDPDPRSEFEMDKPVLFKGKKASHLPWQLSGERAAGVMLYLRAQGILAQSWSIAGYGDGAPLLVESGPSDLELQKAGLNRRIEIAINFHKGPSNKGLTDNDVASLKQSLEMFLTTEPEAPVQQNPTRGGKGAGNGSGSSNGARVPGGSGNDEGSRSTNPGTSGTANPDGLSSEELQRRRKALENRLKKPKGRSDSTSETVPAGRPSRSDALDVPQPKVPKLN